MKDEISLWVPILYNGEPEEQEWYGAVYECPLCGHVGMGEDKYCGGCGAQLWVEVEISEP